ncbi:subtilisin-like protease SBT5.3 isoform X2 [Tripterygium wilfordii]|nr:subtilisin-like protease SBT5.3 isoform X2 [Tripterygium wilfordii]
MEIHLAKNSHYKLLGSLVGSTEKAKDFIFYQYTGSINGFAAILEEGEAVEIAKHPDVVSVFLNEDHELYTTRSWSFLGLERDGVMLKSSTWKKARFGEDTIIGNIDTGVWPESRSFSDKGYKPVPSRWKGICQEDKTKSPVQCNRKLIGARYFNKGFNGSYDKLNYSFNTARDNYGHGTHTLSTVGGNFVDGVSVFGQGNGTAKGGSPKARVAAYKACWFFIFFTKCSSVDVLAAFDAAITDGVDVISVSLSGKPKEFFEDVISIGAFHAIKKGIVVVCSAGNAGPRTGYVANVSPWIITVGASTIDRKFNINSAKNPMEPVTTSRTMLGTIRAPVVANFSSRGPSKIEPTLLKPDIIAPGVNIIAAFTEDPNAYINGIPFPYMVYSGTSMSCPHIAGIVGLLKTLYPNWSPAAIKSAIMTTATIRDNMNARIQDFRRNRKATPFAYGAGHVQPNLAVDPGLIYDLTIDDFLNFLCASGYNQSLIRKFSDKSYTCPPSASLVNFSYPSITVPNLQGSITITRRVKNVGAPGTYKATVKAPKGVSVSVSPTTLVFDGIGRELSFNVTLKSDVKDSERKRYVFGYLTWSDGKHYVNSPIVVKHK